MAKSQELANFEQVVEKIIFNDDELEELKIAIRNFTEGKIDEKKLKHLLLQCRGRMVEDITDFTFLFVEKRTQKLLHAKMNTDFLPSSNKVESQLREEIKEKNELLETLAHRVNQLVSRISNKDSSEDQKSNSNEDVKQEIERCLNQMGAKQWIKMCFYDDYKFFVKLYPKLEALYKERFGESEKVSNDPNNRKETMANKMVRLGFPKDIETILIKYIKIRNNFQHSMDEIAPSSIELVHELFAKILVYLIVSSLNSKLLSNNRESFYSSLKDFFSKRLTGNLDFRKRILERLKTVFYA